MRPSRGVPGTDENVRASLARRARNGCNPGGRLGRRWLYLVPVSPIISGTRESRGPLEGVPAPAPPALASVSFTSNATPLVLLSSGTGGLGAASPVESTGSRVGAAAWLCSVDRVHETPDVLESLGGHGLGCLSAGHEYLAQAGAVLDERAA